METQLPAVETPKKVRRLTDWQGGRNHLRGGPRRLLRHSSSYSHRVRIWDRLASHKDSLHPSGFLWSVGRAGRSRFVDGYWRNAQRRVVADRIRRSRTSGRPGLVVGATRTWAHHLT